MGERVNYTLTFTVPAGTTVDDAVINDPLGTTQTYVASTLAASWTDNGVAQSGLFAGVSASYDATNARVRLVFPSAYTNSTAGDDVFTVTFSAQVSAPRWWSPTWASPRTRTTPTTWSPRATPCATR